MIARIKNFPYPSTFKDLESVRNYLVMLRESLWSDATLLPEDIAGELAQLTYFKTITGITNNVIADAVDDTLTLSSANNILSIVGT